MTRDKLIAKLAELQTLVFLLATEVEKDAEREQDKEVQEAIQEANRIVQHNKREDNN